MSRIDAAARRAMFMRSFAIQGSWNYRTLIGAGVAFTLLPGLRALYPTDPDRVDDAVRRHAELFNGHPYLAPMGVGAVAVMEEEGENAAVIERFKAAIRGSLGTIGDRLVWAGWRPVCLLFAVALLLLGSPWWLVALVFLLLYNAGHLLVRGWAFRVGLRRGRGVGEELRHSSIVEIQRILSIVGAFLAGVVIPLLANGHLTGVRAAWPWLVAAAAVALAGTRFGERVQRPIVLALAGLVAIGFILQLLV
jgi:PTS system mannose-specific IID component